MILKKVPKAFSRILVWKCPPYLVRFDPLRHPGVLLQRAAGVVVAVGDAAGLLPLLLLLLLLLPWSVGGVEGGGAGLAAAVRGAGDGHHGVGGRGGGGVHDAAGGGPTEGENSGSWSLENETDNFKNACRVMPAKTVMENGFNILVYNFNKYRRLVINFYTAGKQTGLVRKQNPISASTLCI